MYSSLREWCVFPVNIHKRDGMTAGGDPKYLDPEEHAGYPVSTTEVITDKTGSEYVSMSRIYFPPDVLVTEEDKIEQVGDEPREIRKIMKYFDAVEKALSILVVYL